MNDYKMGDYKEKPKNDFEYEKPKNSPRERGGCLTVFLAVFLVINVLSVFLLCSQTGRLNDYANGSFGPILVIGFVVECAVIVCIIAMWNWQKWGYYGVMAIYAVSILMSICSGNFLSVLGSIIVMGLLFALASDKLPQFD